MLQTSVFAVGFDPTGRRGLQQAFTLHFGPFGRRQFSFQIIVGIP